MATVRIGQSGRGTFIARARSIGAAAATGLALVAARDLVQKKHTLLRNFPLVGHARYVLETIGPELRQYIVTSNDEERPPAAGTPCPACTSMPGSASTRPTSTWRPGAPPTRNSSRHRRPSARSSGANEQREPEPHGPDPCELDPRRPDRGRPPSGPARRGLDRREPTRRGPDRREEAGGQRLNPSGSSIPPARACIESRSICGVRLRFGKDPVVLSA